MQHLILHDLSWMIPGQRASVSSPTEGATMTHAHKLYHLYVMAVCALPWNAM